MTAEESEPVAAPACECGAEEGQFHAWRCRWELCTFCGSTNASGCECVYDHLGLKQRQNPAGFNYLSETVWKDGLTHEQDQLWRTRCENRGRLPYVYAPQVCGRCGTLWPEIFVVQDTAWEYYAGPLLRSALLCEPCFTTLRQNIDRNQARPAWVPRPEEIDLYTQAWRARDTETMRRLDPEKFKPGSRNLRFP